ncbi:MAG: hypothetical protein ACQKBY_12930 [Verrucomicrobiales bacterium]
MMIARFLSLCCLLTGGLVAGTPGEAVLSALDEVKEGEIGRGNLESLRVSPRALESRRAEIGERWESLGESLRAFSWEYGVERVEKQGDLAAVSVALRGAVSPEEARILVFGLCLVDGDWQVAPVEGSFDSAGLGFGEELRSRRQALEDWMARERGEGLNRVIEAARKEFDRELMAALPEERRRAAKPEEVVMGFLRAAREKRPREMMRWLGFPSDEIEGAGERERLLRVLAKGLRGQDQQDRWKVLVNEGSVALPLREEKEDEGHYLVMGFFNPLLNSEHENLQVHRFLLEQEAEGAWRLKLPGNFAYADEESGEFWRQRAQDIERDDEALKADFALELSKREQRRREATTEGAVKALLAEMKGPHFSQVIPWLVWPEGDDERRKRMALRQVGSEWVSFTRRDGRAADLIGIWEDGDRALALVRISAEEEFPDMEIVPVYLARDEHGWGRWAGTRHEGEPAVGRLHLRFHEELGDLKEAVLAERFAPAVRKFEAGGAVDRQGALDLVETYRREIGTGNLLKVLGHCVFFDEREDLELHLRRLAAVMKGRFSSGEGELLGVTVAPEGVAVTYRSQASRLSDPEYPIVLVVPTAQGARVLADADLLLETSKAKELRNRGTWRRMEKSLPELEPALRKLVTEHQETIKAALKKREAANQEEQEQE